MPFGFDLNSISVWAKEHVWLIVGILIVVIFLVWLFGRGKKKELKAINRGEIERKKFIERNEINKTSYKWFYRGNELIGKIIRLRYSDLKDFKKGKENTEPIIVELVVKKILFNLGFWKPTNPFSKEMCVFTNIENMVKDRSKEFIEVDEKTTYDMYLGLYYDRSVKDEAVEYIKSDSQFRTDWENMASVYWVKSQEQSTFDPEHAHDILLKEKELQIEKEKRAQTLAK